VIQTNNTSNISDKTVIPPGLSDHDLIACVRKMSNSKYQSQTIRCRDFKNYNVDDINNDFINKNWDPLYSTKSPIDDWAHMKSLLKENLNTYAPFITKRIKGKTSPWISN